MDSNNIPRPLSHIGCQDLLHMEPAHNGWLRYRVTLVNAKLARLPLFGNMITNTVHRVRSPWLQKYVVIHKSCVYIFNRDSSTKPQTAFSLFQYNKVQRAENDFSNQKKETLWVFKLIHVNGERRYFSASSKSEMKGWMKELNTEMRKANNKPNRSPSVVSGGSGSSQESDYAGIEESMYGPKDLSMFKTSKVIEINNDDEQEEDYVTYGEMQDQLENAEVDSDEEEQLHPSLSDSLPNLQMRHRMLPLPPTPNDNNVDCDLPSHPAPKPPLSSSPRKGPDRPLPPVPSRDAKPSKSSSSSGNMDYKGNWNELPCPVSGHSNPPTIRSPKLPPGAVSVMMPPNVKPKPMVKPAHLRPKNDDVTMATWNDTKEMVKTKLFQISKDGAFIIRDSESDANQVLSVYVAGEMRKYKIHICPYGKLYLNEFCKFETLLELLDHYKNNYLPNTSHYLDRPYKYYS